MLRKNVKRFRGGLAFKARRPSYHSSLGSRVITKNKSTEEAEAIVGPLGSQVSEKEHICMTLYTG